MKTLDTLLFDLSQKDVHLWMDGDRLRYRAAKNAVTTELLADIKSRKAEIIQFLKQVNESNNSKLPPILRIDRNGSLPLSFAQQRLWYLQQFEPNSSSNNLPVVVRFNGNLNISILEKSLQALVARHEVLRTRFPALNDQPTLVITDDVDLTLSVIDLRKVHKDRRDEEALRLATEEARRPFDLAKSPIFRTLLLRLNDDEYLLVWNMHSIICDGASSDVFYQDLTTIYTAFINGIPSPLKELPIQYVDFAHWQRQWLQGEVLESKINYWKQKLDRSLSVISLPTDYPRPLGVQTYRGDRKAKMLSKSLNDSLNRLSQKLDGTLFMLLIAAFEILLHRYSQEDDIVISFASAVRGEVETEGVIGFFSNTLIQCVNFDGNPTFREFFNRVREASLEANAHQDLPFEKLVEELRPELIHSRSPLFQTKFALNPPWSKGRGMASVKLPDLTITSLFGYIHQGKTKYDLILVMREQEEGLGMVFDYNAELFDSSTITRMLGHFENLLERIIADPDQKVSELPLLTVSEQQNFLHEWNNNKAPIPATFIHQLFEAQVEKNPDAIAVVSKDEHLTYRELNNRANQLAHYLQSQGVVTETLVAICVEKSPQMLVSMLGVLKAGGAYIPLVPSYCEERRLYKLRNAQVPLILTQTNLLPKLCGYDAQMVCIDDEWTAIAQHSQDNPSSSVSSKNLAYVIYTSGSTGQPKGVTISHRSLVNHSLAVSEEYALNNQDRVLQFSNVGFDVAVEEIFPTLLNGSTLVLPPPEIYTSIVHFLENLHQQSITVINLPTAFWHELVHEISILQKPLPQNLRLVIVGGEKVSKSTYQKWISLVGSFPRWLNAYGPTEATITATIYDPLKSPEVLHPDAEVPIGKAISNFQTYILDRNLQPSPIGIAGELYIGGVGLSQGYLNHPELTAQKFIRNPFSSNLEDCLYSTGDEARYLPDGNIEFIGRLDFQIKIRGFRIEPIEIETQLERHPAIRQAVILCKDSHIRGKFLVAYLSAEHAQIIDIDSVREFLQQKLPIYMLPTSFIVLETLPLTPNVKVDRLALLALDIEKRFDEEVISPRDEFEQKLATIWQKLLGIDRVSIHANFFELGGNSLLSVRLVTEIEEIFNYRFPLSSFFQMGTIAEIAQRMREKSSDSESVEDLILGLSLEDYRALLSHSAGKTGLRIGKRGLIINIAPEIQTLSQPFIWIGEVKAGKKLKLQQPLYVMPGASLSLSMNSHTNYISLIAAVLVDELISVHPSNSYLLGGWCYNGLVALEMAQQLHKLGKKVDLLTLLDVTGGSKIHRSLERFNHYLGTIRFHLFNFSKLSFNQKYYYLVSRINKFFGRKMSKANIAKVNKAKAVNDNPEINQEINQIIDLLIKPVLEYPRKPYLGNILLVDASEQIVHGQNDVKHFNIAWLFPYNGFGNLLRGKVFVSKLKCDHLELVEDPYCGEVGKIIQRTTASLLLQTCNNNECDQEVTI